MDLKMIKSGELGMNVTIVTTSGNKLEGTIIKTDTDDGFLKLKTNDGIIVVNGNSIESIY